MTDDSVPMDWPVRDHDAFLASLRDRLHDEADPAVILSETTRRLAEHMGASRTGYGEFTDDASVFVPRHHWTDGSVISMDDPVPFDAFGPAIVTSHRRGELWVHETLDDPKLDAAGREACAQLGIVAVITVPVLKGGKLRSLISVQQSRERHWHDADIALIVELAQLTWASLERARAEEKERILSEVVRHAPIGVYVKDAVGRFQIVNEAMMRLVSLPSDDLTGRTAAELFPPDLADAIAAGDAEAIRSGTVTTEEMSGAPRAPHEHSLMMRVPIQMRSGTGLAGFQIDLTDQKRAEAELERSRESLYQSEKMTALGSLLAGVSHELNNPLSIIVAQAELLELEAAGSAAAERAGKIRRAAERSARIVQTFLAMARQKRPDRAPVQLNDVVTAAMDLAGYGLRAAGIGVEQRLAIDLPLLMGDADQLHQVVVNLVVNAQQAMQDHGGERVLRLTTAASGGRVTVEVADTGPGIPAELRRRVFEPFFTTKPQDVGTGVGLSFSQGIVEAHHGRLEIVPSGQGATFRVTLPADAGAMPTRAEAPANEPVASAATTRSALVIDDEAELADSLSDILRLLGFAVVTLDRGEAAKGVLLDRDFDLIVSDLRMPDTDGPALFAWLSERRPHLVGAMTFSTGDTLSALAAQFLRESGRPFMEKPFTVASVRALVAAVDAHGGSAK